MNKATVAKMISTQVPISGAESLREVCPPVRRSSNATVDIRATTTALIMAMMKYAAGMLSIQMFVICRRGRERGGLGAQYRRVDVLTHTDELIQRFNGRCLLLWRHLGIK
jgi:hypothetical protein